MRLAHSTPTLRPTSTEPVKKILPAVDLTSASPIRPPPWTVRTRPSGKPAFSKIWRIRSPISGVRLAGFEHDAVAGHQRDRDLAERDRPGVVPGRDHADDADRLVGELGALRLQEGLRHRELLVGEDVGAVVGDPLERVDGGQQLHRVALDAGLALLGGEQLGELVELREQHVDGAAHVAGAVLERELRPERLHLGDVVDDPLDLRRGDRLDRADQLAGRRVEGLERGLAASPWSLSPTIRRTRCRSGSTSGSNRPSASCWSCWSCSPPSPRPLVACARSRRFYARPA